MGDTYEDLDSAPQEVSNDEGSTSTGTPNAWNVRVGCGMREIHNVFNGEWMSQWGRDGKKVAEGRVSDVTLCGKQLMVSFDDAQPEGTVEMIDQGFDLFDENCSSKYFFGRGSGDQTGELSVLTDVHRRTVSEVIESLQGCAKLDKDLLLLKCSRKQLVDHIDKEFKNDKVQKKVLLFKFYVLLGRDEEEFASRGKEVMNKEAQRRVIKDGPLAKKDVAFDDKASIERVREVCARFTDAKQGICHRNLCDLIISNAYVVAPTSKGAPKGGHKPSTKRAGDDASDGAPPTSNSGNGGQRQHIVLWLVDLVNQKLPCGRSTSSPGNAGANRDAQGPRKGAASKSGVSKGSGAGNARPEGDAEAAAAAATNKAAAGEKSRAAAEAKALAEAQAAADGLVSRYEVDMAVVVHVLCQTEYNFKAAEAILAKLPNTVARQTVRDAGDLLLATKCGDPEDERSWRAAWKSTSELGRSGLNFRNF